MTSLGWQIKRFVLTMTITKTSNTAKTRAKVRSISIWHLLRGLRYNLRKETAELYESFLDNLIRPLNSPKPPAQRIAQFLHVAAHPLHQVLAHGFISRIAIYVV